MKSFDAFQKEIDLEMFRHPVIRANPYTRWFARGTANEDQVRDLVRQFAVFSNHLPRTFSTRNGHINRLRETGRALGLEPEELGRWESGTPATHAFLNGLDRTCGSEDGRVGFAASFAVETWAAFGIGGTPEEESGNFRMQIIDGLREFNRVERAGAGLPEIPLGFFEHHLRMESGHGAGVWNELRGDFERPGFDLELFLSSGKEALEAVHTFWLGLNRTRLKLMGGPSFDRTGVHEGMRTAHLGAFQAA